MALSGEAETMPPLVEEWTIGVRRARGHAERNATNKLQGSG